MFGLVVLIAAALYCLVMFLAVRGAWRKGLAIGGSRARGFRYAALAFLAVYLPVFWDHIPTLVVHRSLCAKDAGFKAHVDANQWRARNAGAVAAVNRLPREEREATAELPETSEGFKKSIGFGGLLRRDHKLEMVAPWLTVRRSETRISDGRTGELLAVAIDYAAGDGSSEDLRWWTRINSCVARPPGVIGQPAKPVTPPDFLHFFRYALEKEQP